ncbi:long-chain acyl-CoA synthetase [Pseudomonas syringae]|uniref:Long-chain acyl-CoA synthetase n=1 Tax=Pseudomonas syringae TaxID=317 RepID=A0A1C7Z5W3_PSESX|nr:AMP-binding protein [Pseudomonas syringae]OCR25203.1 long-chain acyl-CoA synthetase [Pseudomonas syringae]
MSPELNAFKTRLRNYASTQPETVALWGDDLRLDYAALYTEVEFRQQLLRASEVKTIGLALDNGPQALLWDLAVLFEGLTCVTLPPFFSAGQRLHCLQQSQVGLVIADEALAPELTGAGYKRSGEFWFHVQAQTNAMPQGTAKLTFTSGTTGTPKGVCLSAESMLAVARQLHEASLDAAPSHHLAILPLAILLENVGCYAALYAGATLSLPSQTTLGIQGASGVDVPRMLECLQRRRPESLILVPQLLLMLVSACEMGAFDASMLRFAAVGGARVSSELLVRAQRVGLAVFEGYGLSECASVVALNQPGAQRLGSVGKPLPHVQVRLAEDGEVLIGGSPMLGYLGDPTPAPTWWPSGDLGEFDAEGYLYLKGRKKHQFVTSFGRNVNPEWVEAELTQNNRIAQAFVYGEASPRNHALLWPVSADCTDVQLAEAVERANQALPDYARVHDWTRLEQPFSTANGMATANGRPRREAILGRYGHLFSASIQSEESPS